jgi:carbamoylphosphate synthase small subunit
MHKFDGLFLSNGPGDPTYNVETIEQLKRRRPNVPDDQVQPIFGICLGKPVIIMPQVNVTLPCPRVSYRYYDIGFGL